MFKERKNKAPYLKHYCRGMTDRQISNITGRHVATICEWRKRNNLPPNPKGALRSKGEAHLFLRRLQIARAPEKERRIIRHFMSDLLLSLIHIFGMRNGLLKGCRNCCKRQLYSMTRKPTLS